MVSVDFENIYQHVIEIEDFNLKWHFKIDNKYILPEHHLEQLKPLDNDASKFLWNYIMKTNLHVDIPFKNGFYSSIDKVKIVEGNEQEIKKWLYQRGLLFDKHVFLSYQPNQAIIVP